MTTSCAQSARQPLSEQYPSADGTSTITYEEQGVVISLEAPPEPYQNGESYTAVLKLSNGSSVPAMVATRGGHIFSLMVTDVSGPKVSDAQETRGVPGSRAVDQVELKPGESIVETLPFVLPGPGKYRLHAVLLVEDEQLLPLDWVRLDVTAE